ncbi:MAG: DUF481 domain-containing protein [Nitrospirota bacterium]|nr:DUF481 domain-containing protein [Nitrospirota bacterium]
MHRRVVPILIVMLTAAAMTVVAAPAFAQDAAPKKWSGAVEAGVVSTGGNTKTSSTNLKAKAVREGTRWRFTTNAAMLHTRDTGLTTAERYLASVQGDIKFTTRSYLFINTTGEKDLFSGFTYRISETVGYGRHLLDRERVDIHTEIGAGARQSEVEAAGDHIDEAMGRLVAKLAWKVSQTATFAEEITSEIGEESTVSRSVTSLLTQISGSLSTKLTYTFRNTTSVPPGTRKNDWETALTLVFNY